MSSPTRRASRAPDAIGPEWRDVLQWSWFAALALVVAWPALRLPYFADDLSLLHELARLRLGTTGFVAYLFGIHNEHTIPTLRLAIWVSTWLAGLDPLPIRLAMVGLHALAAWAAGSICAHLSGRAGLSWIAGSLFAAGLGITGSVLWNVTIGVFVIGGCGLALATRRLVCEDQRGIWPAIGWLAFGAAGLNGVAVASAPLALLSTSHPRRWRRIGLLVSIGLLFMLAARWNYSRFTSASPLQITVLGVGKGLLLIGLAPARLVWGWLPFALPRVRIALMLGIVGWSVLAASLALFDGHKRRITLILWSVPLAISMLVGLARAQHPAITFLLTDRYFYPFLLPFAVHCGLLAGLVRTRRSVAFLGTAAVIATLGLVGATIQFRRQVMWGLVDGSRSAWSRWQALSDRLEADASRASSPIAIPTGRIEFQGFAALEISDVLLSSRAGLHGHRFDYPSAPLDDLQAERVNRVLDDWATALPERHSPVCVRNGRLAPNEQGSLDFLIDPSRDRVLGGFGEREIPGYRWMTEHGRLALPVHDGDLLIRASAPISGLRRTRPGIAGIGVRVAVDGAAVADLLIDGDAPQTFVVPRPSAMKREGLITLELTADQTWRPSELDPANLDPRTMSIALFSVRFSGAASTAGTCSVPLSPADSHRAHGRLRGQPV